MQMTTLVFFVLLLLFSVINKKLIEYVEIFLKSHNIIINRYGPWIARLIYGPSIEGRSRREGWLSRGSVLNSSISPAVLPHLPHIPLKFHLKFVIGMSIRRVRYFEGVGWGRGRMRGEEGRRKGGGGGEGGKGRGVGKKLRRWGRG